MADIQRIEYQEDITGPGNSGHPQGLYAVLRYQSVCLLPDMDARQTAMVIERIGEKFPDQCAQWKSPSPFGEHFISLGLNDST